MFLRRSLAQYIMYIFFVGTFGGLAPPPQYQKAGYATAQQPVCVALLSRRRTTSCQSAPGSDHLWAPPTDLTNLCPETVDWLRQLREVTIAAGLKKTASERSTNVYFLVSKSDISVWPIYGHCMALCYYCLHSKHHTDSIKVHIIIIIIIKRSGTSPVSGSFRLFTRHSTFVFPTLTQSPTFTII